VVVVIVVVVLVVVVIRLDGTVIADGHLVAIDVTFPYKDHDFDLAVPLSQ
jgi:hypothetical protein